MDDTTIPDLAFEMTTVVFAPPETVGGEVATTAYRRKCRDRVIWARCRLVSLFALLVLLGAGGYALSAVFVPEPPAAGPAEEAFAWPAAQEPRPAAPPAPEIDPTRQSPPSPAPTLATEAPTARPALATESEPLAVRWRPPAPRASLQSAAPRPKARPGKLRILCTEPFHPIVDGMELETMAPLALRPGVHRVRVRYLNRGRASQVRAVRVRPGKTSVAFFVAP